MTRTASAVGAFLLAIGPAALAEGPPGQPPRGGVFPQVAEIQEEEARPLHAALDKALESKEERRILDALAPMVTRRHASFVPDLKKLVADRRVPVAAAAAEALGSQGDKTVAPLLVKVVSSDVRERGFLKDAALKAAAIESLGRLGVTGGFDAILRVTEKMLQEPDVRTAYAATIVRAAMRYFGLTKEKRAVGLLIDEVDQPEPANPESGSNPPAEYWKARHDIWVVARPEAVWALKEITGREFESGRRWRNWFESEGKKEGMK